MTNEGAVIVPRIGVQGKGTEMRRVIKLGQRSVSAMMMAILVLLAAPVMAHENHDQLGAGPGTQKAAKPTQEKAAVPAPVAANMHEGMAMEHEEAAAAHEEAADANKTTGQRLVSWLGRMHPFSVHFPIAMFFGAVGVELFGLWRRNREYQRAAFVMLVVGAIGAVVAAALGWFAGGFYWTDRNPILMIHRWLGTAIALFAVLLVYLTAKAHRRSEQPRSIYWAVLGLMTIGIAVQGYLGASFMHGGMDHGMF